MANLERGPPSVAAIATATAIISFLMGYYFGQARSIGLFGGRSNTTLAGKRSELPSDDESDLSDADAQSGDDLGELSSFLGSNEECKLVLVARTDLGMTRGTPPSHIFYRTPISSSGFPVPISAPAGVMHASILHKLTVHQGKSQRNALTPPSLATKHYSAPIRRIH